MRELFYYIRSYNHKNALSFPELKTPMNRHIILPETGRKVEAPRLFCIGRNYAAHAAEMNSPMPEQPMVFIKPSTCIIRDQGTIVLPPQSRDVHHEVELVAVIGKEGKNIPVDLAADYIEGFAVGLDMTARDVQAQAKKRGHPWSVAKGFDTFAPLGSLVPKSAVSNAQELEIKLLVNGGVRQSGTTASMHFSVFELVAYCSTIFTLLPGDLLFTGTPEGVGPVHGGDVLEASVEGMPELSVTVQSEG